MVRSSSDVLRDEARGVERPSAGRRLGQSVLLHEDELELLTLVDEAHLAALGAFSRRVLYSAVDYSPDTPNATIGIDHMVPFRSSSLRTEIEAQEALEDWIEKGGYKQWNPVCSEDTGRVQTLWSGTPPRTTAEACLKRLSSLDFYKVDVVMRGFALLAHRGLVNPGSPGGLALARHLAHLARAQRVLDLLPGRFAPGVCW